jgi:hypothetical protein
VWLVPVDREPADFVGPLDAVVACSEDFEFPAVPAERSFRLFGSVASFAARGVAFPSRLVQAPKAGERLDLGDLRAVPALTLEGRVTVADGKPVPPGTALTLERTEAWEVLPVPVAEDGTFVRRGLPPEPIALYAAIPGFRLAPDQPGLDPRSADRVLVTLPSAPLHLRLVGRQ